jgi:hypothetical protein
MRCGLLHHNSEHFYFYRSRPVRAGIFFGGLAISATRRIGFRGGGITTGGQMAKKSLDGRHRDKTGRIDKKHGNALVGSLRQTYGEHFAAGHRKDMMLKTLLSKTGTESITSIYGSITNRRDQLLSHRDRKCSQPARLGSL